MSISMEKFKESSIGAGANGAECTPGVELDVEGGKEQAVRSLAVVRGEGRALARKVIEAVLPTFADLEKLRAQEFMAPTWVDLWRTAGRAPELLEKVVRPAAQGLLEYNQRILQLDGPCESTGTVISGRATAGRQE
jgi:hypothetical protein